MLELKDISKIYRIDGKPFYALNKVNVKINDGELVAIQGKSGAGKSTLLHILGCLDTFNEGDYLIDGKSISNKTPSEIAGLRNRHFGFVLQDFSLINQKTALYNVTAPMFFNNTPFFSMKKKAMSALEAMGVADQAKKRSVNMSGGQRQRVAIARAIVNDPSVILADEPTGNLDSATAEDIMSILRGLNKNGRTVVIVTHDDGIAASCDRIIRISDGRIAAY